MHCNFQPIWWFSTQPRLPLSREWKPRWTYLNCGPLWLKEFESTNKENISLEPDSKAARGFNLELVQGTHELPAVSSDFSPAPESENWFLFQTLLIYLILGKQQTSLVLPQLPDLQKFVTCICHGHLVRVKESVYSDTGFLWETEDFFFFFEKKQMLSTTLFYLVRFLDQQLARLEVIACCIWNRTGMSPSTQPALCCKKRPTICFYKFCVSLHYLFIVVVIILIWEPHPVILRAFFLLVLWSLLAGLGNRKWCEGSNWGLLHGRQMCYQLYCISTHHHQIALRERAEETASQIGLCLPVKKYHQQLLHCVRHDQRNGMEDMMRSKFQS